MKYSYPPQKIGSRITTRNNASLSFLFCLFMLACYAVKAQDLSVSPEYSQLTIIVANPSTGLLDKTVVGFNPNSTLGFNPVYDANKLLGASNRQTMYTINSGEWMAINILPDEATIDTVAMGFIPGTNSTFVMSFSGLSSFDTTSYIYLEDKQLDIWYNLRKGDYTFTSITTDNPNRFRLHFTPPVVITGSNTTCSATTTVNIQQPGMAYWNYTLMDSNNTAVDSGVLNQNQPASLQVVPGNYNLVLNDTNGYVAAKSIQVSGPQPMTALVNFQLSDSSVDVMQAITLTDSALINDSASTGATGYQWNFDNGTTGTGTDTTISYTKPGVYNISLTMTNASGCSATQTQTITVISNQATAIAAVSTAHEPQIWSNSNKVFVDLTGLQTVDATVTMYNVLGQEICTEHCTDGAMYQKEMGNMPSSYLIVKVLNGHDSTVKKVFIANK